MLCEAAAVLIAEQAPQHHVEELLHAGAGVDSALLEGTPFPWRELEMFAPVRGVKSRHRCVGLPFEALHAALHAALGSCTGGDPGRPERVSR